MDGSLCCNIKIIWRLGRTKLVPKTNDEPFNFLHGICKFANRSVRPDAFSADVMFGINFNRKISLTKVISKSLLRLMMALQHCNKVVSSKSIQSYKSHAFLC